MALMRHLDANRSREFRQNIILRDTSKYGESPVDARRHEASRVCKWREIQRDVNSYPLTFGIILVDM